MVDLDGFLSLISNHSEALVNLLAGGVTGFIWSLSRRARLRVLILAKGLLYLEIENIGKRIARQVTVEFTPPYIPFPERSRGEEDVHGFLMLGDMDNGQRYEFSMGRATDIETLRRLQRTKITVSQDRNKLLRVIPFVSRKTATSLYMYGPGIVGSSADEHATPIAKIADQTRQLVRVTKDIVTNLNRIDDKLRPLPSGGEHITTKVCSTCHWEEFAFRQLAQSTMYSCNNCGTDFVKDEDCECEGAWCIHTPAPSQCVRLLE